MAVTVVPSKGPRVRELDAASEAAALAPAGLAAQGVAGGGGGGGGPARAAPHGGGKKTQ